MIFSACAHLSRSNSLSRYEQLRIDVVQVPLERFAFQAGAEFLATADVAKIALEFDDVMI